MKLPTKKSDDLMLHAHQQAARTAEPVEQRFAYQNFVQTPIRASESEEQTSRRLLSMWEHARQSRPS